jgi:hypothetical protein
MMACSDRRPMLPVVHWITRSGRSVLALLIGTPLCRYDGVIIAESARCARVRVDANVGIRDDPSDTASRRGLCLLLHRWGGSASAEQIDEGDPLWKFDTQL